MVRAVRGVVGHSFGGAVAANAVAGSIKGIPPLAAERLVLIAAPNSLPAIFDEFGDLLNLGPRSRAAVARQVERIAGRPLREFTGSLQLAGTPVPALIIHAPDDREVSPEHAVLYAAAGAHVRLHWTPGLGHRRILADRGVLEEALGFVTGTPLGDALSKRPQDRQALIRPFGPLLPIGAPIGEKRKRDMAAGVSSPLGERVARREAASRVRASP